MGILTWIIVGLIAGFIAKMLMPGSNNEPSGWVGTVFLGVVGAILGGFLSSLFLGGGGANGINVGSILVAVVGACVFIALLRLIKR